jgi:hypothetical protein
MFSRSLIGCGTAELGPDAKRYQTLVRRPATPNDVTSGPSTAQPTLPHADT